MDVRCERCSTEYEFDDALVSDKGTTVKCMSCGHQFRVARPSALKAPDKWLVRRPDGQELVFVSLRELQKAIAAHQVGKEDHLFRGALRARSLGSIPELQPFFERAARPPKTTSRGLGMAGPSEAPAALAPSSPPLAAPKPSGPPQALPSLGLTQPFALNASAPPPLVHPATPPPIPPAAPPAAQAGTLRPPALPPPSSPPALPSMNEPIAPISAMTAPTPMPPPIVVSPPAPVPVRPATPVRTQAPATTTARMPAVSTAKSTPSPPPAAPTPPPATVKSAPPPPAVAKSAPPPPMGKTAPPPIVRSTPPPAAVEALPAFEPPEPPPKPRLSSNPPARKVVDDEQDTRPVDRPRVRSVPSEPDRAPRREAGLTAWIVAGSILGLTALFAGTLGRKYLTALSPTGSAVPPTAAPAATPGPAAATTASAASSATVAAGVSTTSAAVLGLLAAADKSTAEGDLEGARDTLVRASAQAPQDAKVLVALARVDATKADVAWLRLRLLPKTATDARRIAASDLGDAAKRALAAADAASAAAPDSPDALRAKLDALRLTDDLAAARTLAPRLRATTQTSESALALGTLDLAGEEPPSPATLEKLRTASASGSARARAVLIYALAKAGDPDAAGKELEKLAALTRPHPLLPELRTLVSTTKQTAVVGGADTGSVAIGKLPTVGGAMKAEPEGGGYKVNDAPAAPTAAPTGAGGAGATAGTPPATTAAPHKEPKPPAGKQGEFTEEELHRKLFGDQPK